jgi:hypothetical protein
MSKKNHDSKFVKWLNSFADNVAYNIGKIVGIFLFSIVVALVISLYIASMYKIGEGVFYLSVLCFIVVFAVLIYLFWISPYWHASDNAIRKILLSGDPKGVLYRRLQHTIHCRQCNNRWANMIVGSEPEFHNTPDTVPSPN